MSLRRIITMGLPLAVLLFPVIGFLFLAMTYSIAFIVDYKGLTGILILIGLMGAGTFLARPVVLVLNDIKATSDVWSKYKGTVNNKEMKLKWYMVFRAIEGLVVYETVGYILKYQPTIFILWIFTIWIEYMLAKKCSSKVILVRTILLWYATVVICMYTLVGGNMIAGIGILLSSILNLTIAYKYGGRINK